jgi:tetratricopeptide (TPR) repeat protein
MAVCPSAANGQGLIRTCYSPQRDGGELHVLARHSCTKPEKELAWNRAGIQGRAGTPGLAGPPGPPGRSCVCSKQARRPHAHCHDHQHSGGAKDFFKMIIELGGLALGALLVLVAVGLAALHLLARTPYIKDTFLVRRARPTSFTVEVLDDNAITQRIGPAITGLVRNRISVRGDRLGLDFVTGQRIVRRTLKSFKDIAVPVPNASGTAGVALVVIGFLAKTLPRRRFVLRGELQPRGSAGTGISLALQDNGGEDSLTTLWSAALDVRVVGVGAYQRLAVPAAAWTDHQLTTALASRAPSELLSRNADSWAFFRAGLECHRLGEDEPARSLYEQALGHDGGNFGALANLGLLERREHHFERAEKLLKDALAEHEERRISRQRTLAYRIRALFVTKSIESDPDWYRIRYQLAALYLNRATFNEGAARLEKDVQRALEKSKELARTSITAALSIDRTASRRPRGVGRRSPRVQERSELSGFLHSTIIPSALTLLAGVLFVSRSQNNPALRAASDIHFCFYQDVLDALDKDILDADELVKFVERQPQLAPRVYYNLACYRTLRHELHKAMKRLEQALLRTTITERLALLKIIEKDTTLATITAGAEFMEGLRTYLPPRS